jgi:diguanylate cyclase (GGDEF)-like protein
VLKAEARRSDRVARLGGDEFVVLLSEVDADQAQATARRLRERLRSATGVGASAGVATTSEPAEDSVEELIRRADAALYAEKRRRTGTPPRD